MLESTEVFAPIEGPSAWYGSDMAKRPNEWLHRLDDAEVAEINEAVAALIEAGTPILEVDRKTFPLPNLGPVLDPPLAETRMMPSAWPYTIVSSEPQLAP